MTEKNQNEMHCGRFEALLSDALDGLLAEDVRGAFQAHAETCAACGPIFSEARQGMLWLQSLEEVQTPANLLHNILAATSAVAETQAGRAEALPSSGWIARLWKPARGMLAGALQPRFATSFSMAFFSLSLTLTLAGVKLKDITQIDWRPSAVGKAVVLQYTQVESKVVRYYNNMRLVYEIQSRVGELKKNSATEQNDEKPAPEQPKTDKKKKDNNDTSSRPEQRQDNYSQETDDAVIAYLTPSNEGANQ